MENEYSNPFGKLKNPAKIYVFGPNGCLGDPVVETKPKLETWIDSRPNVPKDSSTWVKIMCVGYRDGKKTCFDVNEYGMVELPADNPKATNGQFTFEGHVVYKYYNRNDENGVADQWGKAEHIVGLINAIIEYRDTYPNDLLDIGDMRSPKDGKVPKNSKGGLHHGNKGAVDIRVLGKGGSFRGEFTDTRHDLERSKVFIKAMSNNGYFRLFVGRNIYEKLKDCANNKLSVHQDKPGDKTHSNHYHFDVD